MAKRYTELILPDSGVVLRIMKVSPLLIRDATRSLKAPKPPLREVQYESGARKEPNESDPAYLEELAEHRERLGDHILRLCVRLGVEVEVDHEAVAELRTTMEKEFGVKLSGDDKYLFVTRLCCVSSDDISALRDSILRRSRPTEEATAEAVEQFPSDVPRP